MLVKFASTCFVRVSGLFPVNGFSPANDFSPANSFPVKIGCFHALSCLMLSFVLCSTLYAEEDELLILNEQSDFLGNPFPIVLTASRLKQHKSRAPASMTVIDKEMIVASGVREIYELFRLVPGMKVSNISGHQAVVTYHDVSAEFSRRLQVLIDGRSIYKPALASVGWSDLPITIEDIQRIEVVRSPNAASYGANAFLGVINIITEHPDDVPGTQLSYTNGDTKIRDGFIRHSQREGDFSWRLSLKQQNDDGFDTSKRPGDSEVERHNSKFVDVVNFRGIYDLNISDYLDFSLGYSNAEKYGEQKVKPAEKYDVINTEEFYTHFLWHHEFHASHALETQFNYSSWNDRNDWTGCTDPIFFGSALCAQINQDLKQERMDLQIQDTYQLNQSLRFVAGASLDVERAESETYLGGRIYNHRQRLFTNMEWQIMPDWLVNMGVLIENDSIVDVSVEPRVAVNYQFKPNHIFRYSWSKATRTPDLFEHDGEWAFKLREKELLPAISGINANSVPFSLPVLTPSNDTHEEKITSQEIAYIGAFPEYHLNIDMKIYRDAMRDLIHEGFDFNNGLFMVDNSTDLNLTGFEVSADYSPVKSIRLVASYGYSHAHVLKGDNKEQIEKAVPDHSASLMGIFKLPRDWQFSSTWYYADTSKGFDEPGQWERVDFRLSKQIKLSDKHRAVVSAVIQHRLDNNADFREENYYDSDNKIYATIG